jgi:hypothetical protein
MFYFRKFNRFLLISLALLGLSISSVNAATVHTADFIADGTRTNFNGFEGTPSTGSFGSTYTEDGITVAQINGIPNGIWTGCGGCFGGGTGQPEGVRSWYPNGGDNGYTSITLSSGMNFTDVGFFTGNGGGSTSLYLYVLLSGGAAVQTGNVATSFQEGGYLGFGGGGFDTILVRSSGGGTSFFDGRPNIFALDGIELAGVPSAVPVPTAVWLFGTALIGLFGFGKRKPSIAA